MNWIMEPLSGFKELGTMIMQECSTHYDCSCQGGLCVCTVPKALTVIKPPVE